MKLRWWWWLAGPCLTLGSGTAAIIELARGEPMPRPFLFFWPAMMIVWALLVLVSWHTQELLRRQVRYQQQTIEMQIEAIGQLQQLLYIASDDG